jgi:AraC family transcriptional regulator
MRNPEAKFIMVKICQELLANDSDSETSIHMLLLQLITEMQKAKTDKGEPSWVESARDFLHSHSNNVTTLDDLSRISNLHPVNISKLFPKYFACTVGEYKRKLKVEKALAIIKSNPPSLSHVAYECGFFDQSHFIRTFKRLTGYLPSDYHKLQER